MVFLFRNYSIEWLLHFLVKVEDLLENTGKRGIFNAAAPEMEKTCRQMTKIAYK